MYLRFMTAIETFAFYSDCLYTVFHSEFCWYHRAESHRAVFVQLFLVFLSLCVCFILLHGSIFTTPLCCTSLLSLNPPAVVCNECVVFDVVKLCIPDDLI